MGAARRRTQLRCRSAQTGFEIPGPLGKNTKRPGRGVSYFGGEGGMGAARRRTQLRCCSARTGFEVLDPRGEKSKKGPDGAPFSFLAVQPVLCGRCSAGIRVTNSIYLPKLAGAFDLPSNTGFQGNTATKASAIRLYPAELAWMSGPTGAGSHMYVNSQMFATLTGRSSFGGGCDDCTMVTKSSD